MFRDLKDPRAEELVRRHGCYWRNEEGGGEGPLWGRPLFQVRRAVPLADTAVPHVLEPPEPLDEIRFREGVERSYDQHGLLEGDLIRMVSTGITSEALVGCRILARHGTHWAEPCFVDWRQLDAYRVRQTPWFARLMENTRRAVEAVGEDRYPFCCMAFRGPVDMAEAMMTGERLCEAVVDHPQELKGLLARITDTVIETGLAHSRLLPSHSGGGFNSYGIWTPGRTVTFTVDGACLFSPACYEEFFLPYDRRLCEAFETPFVHLHAASRQHFQSWAEIPNLGLQCVIDQAWLPTGQNRPIGPQLGDLLPQFKGIRGVKSLMLYGFWEEALVEAFLGEVKPGGCAITGTAEDPEGIRQRFGVGRM